MRNPVLDVTPLHTDHRARGIGAYVRCLRAGFVAIGRRLDTWGFDEPAEGITPTQTVRRLVRKHRLARGQLRAWGARGLASDSLPHFTSETASGVRWRGPYLATVYDLVPAMFPDVYLQRPRARRRYRRYLQHLQRATHLLTVSQTGRRDAAALLGRSERDFTVTPLAVPPLPAPAPAGDGPAYVLAVGTTEPHKNLAFLVDVMSSLDGRARQTPVYVTGVKSDVDWRRLSESAEARGVRIEHLGQVERQTLSDLYAGANAVLVPSLYEGFGLPALEALSVGARVVVSDRGALPEVVGRAAEVLALDVELWASRLSPMILDGTDHDPAPGVEWARAYTWTATARLTAEAYDRFA